MSEAIEFPNLLRESILDGMKYVLGDRVAQAVLYHLGSIQLEKPNEFHPKLSLLFKVGAVVIEKAIIKELFPKLNLPYEEGDDFDFEKYVENARDAFERRTGLR